MNNRFTASAGLSLAAAACLGSGLLYTIARSTAGRATSSAVVTAMPASTLLIVGFDRSGSYRAYLGGAIAAGSSLTADLDADTRLACYALDTQTTELYDNPPPESSDELAGIVTEKLRHLPAAQGTHPASFWTVAAQRAEEGNALTAVALYSDGDDDAVPASQAQIRAAARRLAQNRNVVFVAIYGVNPDNRAALNAAFAPLGRDRFHLYGPQEADTETLLSCLEQARNR